MLACRRSRVKRKTDYVPRFSDRHSAGRRLGYLIVRICYVVSSLEGGGAEFIIPDVIRALEASRHEVDLLACSLRDGLAADRLAAHGISFEILASSDAPRHHSMFRLMRHLRTRRPDLIWTSLPKATLDGQITGRLLGIPVVSWQHSAFTKGYKAWAMPLLQRMSRLWIADSASVSRYLHAVMRVPDERIAEWPLFIADHDRPQAAAWTGQGPFRIGSVGRLHYHKDYPTLLQAFAHLRETSPETYQACTLAIAGSGPDEAYLRDLARTLGIADRLEFTGYLSDPSDFLAGLHLYVQPSRMEGMCIAAHEAMAAGLAVLATPVGELATSVKDGETGYHIARSDFRDLAGRIAQLAQDPVRAHLLGRTARTAVLERFSRARFVAHARAITELAGRF